MTFLQGLWAVLKALPVLIKLFQKLQQRIDEAGVDRQVAEDVKTIHAAFEANDATRLDALFAPPPQP